MLEPIAGPFIFLFIVMYDHDNMKYKSASIATPNMEACESKGEDLMNEMLTDPALEHLDFRYTCIDLTRGLDD